MSLSTTALFCCLDDFARAFEAFCVLMHALSGEETGIYVADSTGLAVCANPRIRRNRTFKGLAAGGHATMGCFFGFKLHVVMNHHGELMAVKITPGMPVSSGRPQSFRFVFARLPRYSSGNANVTYEEQTKWPTF